MPEWDFERECRTPNSECYTVLDDEDRNIYGQHTHIFMSLNGRLAPHLAELVRHELIFAEESDGGSSYRLKHALLQDAVYNTLLSAEREALHAAVAEALERAYVGREAEVADELAHHYGRTSRFDK